MKLKWQTKAKASKTAIANYIRHEFGAKRKIAFLQQVKQTTDLLKRSPGIGQIDPLFDIRHQIDDEQYRLLPISYIARKYFGKSHAWLSQRINGTKVRGRVYTLNAEQKQIFNNAMQDLSRFYSSFRIA